jgi:hypothetical protein
VDTFLFVVTHSRYRSARWTDENLGLIPRLYPFVVTNATPVHAVSDRTVRVLTPLAGAWGALKAECTLLRANDQGLQVAGWLRKRGGISSVAVVWDHGPPVSARIERSEAAEGSAITSFHAHFPPGSIALSAGRHTIGIRINSGRWLAMSRCLNQDVEIIAS